MISVSNVAKNNKFLATVQVNSILEIDNSVSADDDHWSGENSSHGTKETQKMSSCGGVVGVDEPLKMRLSFQ